MGTLLLRVICFAASASAAVISRAKVDQSSLDALVGGNDDRRARRLRSPRSPPRSASVRPAGLVACDATDPVFTPGEERSAEDVPFFRVVLPLPADPHPDQIKAPAKHH